MTVLKPLLTTLFTLLLTLGTLTADEGKPSVFVFVTTDCPVARAYMPELRKLYKKYEKKGVEMTLVQVVPDLSEADAQKHAKEYRLKMPVVIDRSHELVRETGAEATPEAVIRDANGKQVYRGRINNLYADYGDRRRKATIHDVEEVLDALLAGKPSPKDGKDTPALGCIIEPL